MNLSERLSPLRIAINAQRSPSHEAGGVESIIIGLISALGKLTDGMEDYIIIGSWQDPDWLSPYLGANQTLVRGPSEDISRPFERVPATLRPVANKVHKFAKSFLNLHEYNNPVPLSDGFYEGLGCDLIHFPYQLFTLCALPMIYNPHDLQHLHYPQFFTPNKIQWREQVYQAGCHYAQMVITGSQWIKDDIAKHYHTHPDKIQVIPWGPPTQAIEEPSAELLKQISIKYNLPSVFAFYPAMTWEHKNHLRLLDAIAYLRDSKNIDINIICTGNLESNFWPRIEAHIQKRNLQSQVTFLGTVPFEELRAIYRLSQFVIIPTLFEAASGPVFESWYENVPVACSHVTSLPEQVGDAALVFDPFSIEAIAHVLEVLHTNESLRTSLAAKGKKRLLDFNWERTAKAYRAVYRKVSNRQLTEEDKVLLSWDWMRHPKPLNEATI